MTSALTIQNLRKVYGNGFEALKGISFEVQQGISSHCSGLTVPVSPRLWVSFLLW